ncbi:MAG TPA: trypsin-like peptidase domain-containing protein [Chthoniobacterales bacterium]|nr:trypsin-like peptidase domain-containing protein [Chthoniobacterales bacterium]
MKNLFKFFLFVALLSLGISALYDYRLKHGGLGTLQPTPEKYTLADSPNVDPKQVASLEALNQERRALVKSVVPSVVAVKTSKKIGVRRQGMDPFEFFFGNPRRQYRGRDEALVQNSLGSGVIVTNEGHIVTNNHVVAQVDEIEVQLSDGRTEKARLVGADAQMDIAVLKIDNPSIKPLVLADSDSVQVGDFVVAIGNPFGFEETVTDGIISYKGRASEVGELLQTNAAINPGNSGGPLINLRGEVVGINTAIISTSGTSAGVGFAIPSNTVRTALETLLKQGRIIHGYLGVQMRVAQPGQAAAPSDGVVVDEIVSGSPADNAHIQKGDVIRKFDGHDVKSFTDLRRFVSQADLNKKVELEIERGGKTMTVSTQIKEQPAGYQTGQVAPQQPPTQQNPDDEENDEPTGLSGIHVGELTPALARQLDLPNGIHGVVVTNVDSSSGGADLQKGDVIEEMNQQPINSVADYNKIVGSLDPNQPQVLSVCRHRVRSFLVLRSR